MEKALRSNFATLFLRGCYFLPPLIAIGGIYAPTRPRQLTPKATQDKLRLFVINYIHIYRGCLKISFLLFCSSPATGSFVNLSFLVGFGSGAAGYSEH
jgi:hypothetical protein